MPEETSYPFLNLQFRLSIYQEESKRFEPMVDFSGCSRLSPPS
jgi:hypothetical protein